ncbi:uncharacterized protein LOC117245925 isoform X2 [Epinephelus lanceolatus]|uniref:uncharacterized protein LOC117245925 isoform X2 n=1 Tax=Epinephelus lanceolatus TaxID=310571 RepID=UPI00144619EB|nr:uncharacterized protein LOC117245925 isoform X2 [Epinephelus lanceolatus]
MMKLWSRLCFLVLATSSISRGQNVTAVSQGNATQNDAARTTLHTPSPQTQTSVNATDLSSQNITTPEKGPQSTDDVVTTQEVNGKAVQTTAPVSTAGGRRGGVTTDVATVAIAMTSASLTTAIAGTAGSSWGYVILVLIILVIIVLCAILYFLRRVSRTYSFDLHRQVPADHLNEPIGTFEPVYLDDLDQPAPKDQVTTDDLSPPPVSNGTALQSEEYGSNGETAPQEQPDANGLQPSPASNSSPSLDDNPADKTPSPLSSTNLFFNGIGEEQQNENNNNPSVCSSDPFVEINLDEPAWCDQFLTSPEASSSVLPFTPFSFSTSPSSS